MTRSAQARAPGPDRRSARAPAVLRQWWAGKDWDPGDRAQVAIVSFSHAVQHSYVAVLGIVYPFALAEFHSSYAVLGVILGIAGLAGGLLQAMVGIVRRVQTRTLLGAQNLAMAVVSGVGALSPGIAVFGTARLAGNLVSWPQHPVGSAYLTERVPGRRGLVLAAHTTGGNLGTLVTPLAASAVLAAFGWRWALACFGVLMAAGGLLTWSRLDVVRPGAPAGGTRFTRSPETGGRAEPARTQSAQGRLEKEPGQPEKAPAQPATEPPGSLARALRRRPAVAVLVAGIVSAAGRGLGVLTTYIPAYLRSGLHQPPLVLGAVVTVVGIGAIGGPMIGGHLSDRLGRRPVLYTLYALGAVSLAGFVMVGSSPFALALAGLAVGIFAYSEQPVRQALFSDAMHGVPPRAAFGAYFAISQSVGALWITVIGFLITTAGFNVAFWVMGASFVLAGLVIAVFCRDAARRPSTA